MSAYARLAKLPPPKLAPLDVAGFVDRVATLEKAHHIQVVPGPRVTIQGDGDQLEQLLINLIRNAVDAVRETGGGVSVGWQRLPGSSPPTMELWVEDEGPGLVEHGQPVRAVLHDQAGRLGHRPRAQPADRRSARRQPDPREPRGPAGMPRQPAHSRFTPCTPVKPEAVALTHG